MKIPTVNVIELFSGIFESIDSFSEDLQGNAEAQVLFRKKLTDNDFELTEDEIQDIIDDGYFECGKFELLLTHSN